MDFETAIIDHYTANGSTQIAIIPQFAIPPGEAWSIDIVGIDLRNRAVLFIEVSSAQTPSANLISKLQRRNEWLPVARSVLEAGDSPIDDSWKNLVIVFVIEDRVQWLRNKLGSSEDLIVASINQCLPYWITFKEPQRGEPRFHKE